MYANPEAATLADHYTEEEILLAITQHGSALTELARLFHAFNVKKGWWDHIESGNPKDRNYGELLCLVHSELSESMEGHRKDLADDHLPEYPMAMVEIADALIRLFDMWDAMAYYYQCRYQKPLEFGDVLVAKALYNARRADHKRENRLDGGKQY